ncbi:MAG: metallophosphoesterase family protein [Bacteroidota bacterium]
MLFTIQPEFLKKFERLLVAGDIHGDMKSFQKIFSIFHPEKDMLLFLGDYADRGDSGVEIIETLLESQRQKQENIILLLGNHELYSDEGLPSFRPCDLMEEATQKRGSWDNFFEETLKPFLNHLYHAALIPGESLFLHAGISPMLKSASDLERPHAELVKHLLWSDPTEEKITFKANRIRGEGLIFGEELTQEVCKKLNIRNIIRSHQPRLAQDGPHYMHHNKIITMHSTASYSGKPHLLEIPLTKPHKIETHFL